MSIFNRRKNRPAKIEENHNANTPSADGYTEKSLGESKQCSGMDFVLNLPLSFIRDTKEALYTEDYSCVTAVINGRPAALFIFTVMYPNDYNEIIRCNRELLLQAADKTFPSCDIDIYALGIGLANKSDEEGKGVYKIGSRYAVSLGNIYLLKTAEKNPPGLSEESAIELSMVADEYYFIDKLNFRNGQIIDRRRVCSVASSSTEHILDKWEITVHIKDAVDLTFVYAIYIDAYATNAGKATIKIPLFFTLDD